MSETVRTETLIALEELGDEGIDGRWEIGAERFGEESPPLTVTGPVSFVGQVYRVGDAINVSGQTEGTLLTECSRCLGEYRYPFGDELRAVYLRRDTVNPEGEEVELTGDDLDVTLYSGDEIDLYGPIRDQVALAVPMKPLCDEECKGLCQVCGANLNETECGCEPSEGENPFAVLKKLKLDGNNTTRS